MMSRQPAWCMDHLRGVRETGARPVPMIGLRIPLFRKRDR
jgi:hypothetical protein